MFSCAGCWGRASWDRAPVKARALEKAEDSRSESSQIHLFLAVVGGGAEGWSGRCQICRIPAPNTLPASKSIFISFFMPCVFRKKRTFCRFLCSVTDLQRSSGAVSIFHGNKIGRLWILHTVWAKRATIWYILIHAFWVSSNEKYQESKLKECQGYFWSLQNR